MPEPGAALEKLGFLTFEREDYMQILTDIATRLGPALGWRPS